MDVGELLSYQPNRGTKRPRDDEEEELKMRRRQAGTRERGRYREEEMTVVEEADDDKKRLLQIIDREGEEEEEEEEPLDESSVKKMILTFEKRSYKNQELRIKFPDNPEKFMESELDLNDIIQEMHVVATMPDLYHLLVELNAVQSLLGLLGHDNTDVSIAVVDLLQELTDIDTLHESEEGAEVLTDALVDGQVVALLVQNLERLDESVKEEADGVHNTLAIVENMAEFRPEMCTEAAQQGLLQWLLKRLKAKMPFDANKLYCSEVLAILLQDNDENRELLGELDGIDVLLQQLSVFKRHNPSTAEEQEMMENLFDSLCSCLMLSSNRERFLKGEGLQLMNLMLREKKISRSSALKVLDHAMIGPEGTDNCHKFVDILGLRTIFPLFMKSPRKIKKVGTTEKEHEEHVCSILASLLRNLRGQQRTRLLNKFTENDSEKVDRLMELHFKYLDAVQVADKKIEGEKHDMVRRGEIIDNDIEDEFYLRRLDAGLFVLQHICYIMAEICNANVPQIRQRVHQILNMRGSSIKIVRHIIKDGACEALEFIVFPPRKRKEGTVHEPHLASPVVASPPQCHRRVSYCFRPHATSCLRCSCGDVQAQPLKDLHFQCPHIQVRGEHRGRQEPGIPGERTEAHPGLAGELLGWLSSGASRGLPRKLFVELDVTFGQIKASFGIPGLLFFVPSDL
ncbi:beta-catenin-like protein 1 isoform X1 [Ovis aries]|nr:beta-catenin-like protein 1 isoform X1 [Ovis aries]